MDMGKGMAANFQIGFGPFVTGAFRNALKKFVPEELGTPSQEAMKKGSCVVGDHKNVVNPVAENSNKR